MTDIKFWRFQGLKYVRHKISQFLGTKRGIFMFGNLQIFSSAEIRYISHVIELRFGGV